MLSMKKKNELIFCTKAKAGIVVIPDGMVKIGQEAFADCENVTGIMCPASILEIGSLAFSNCKKLTEIIVAEGNKWYASEDGVLYNKDKTELMICPKGKKGTLRLAKEVKEIKNEEFQNCSGLTEIIAAEENEAYASYDGVLYDKEQKKLIKIPEGKVGGIIFNEKRGGNFI